MRSVGWTCTSRQVYLDLKCLLYKMASNFLQPGVFIIENNSSCSIETIDTSSKNKFSWSWLKEKDVNEDYLSKYVRKVSKDGKKKKTEFKKNKKKKRKELRKKDKKEE